MASKVLKIDFDWPIPKRWLALWEVNVKHVLEREGYHVQETIIRDKGVKGYHVWVHLDHAPATEEEVNRLQWQLLDDPVRVRINQLRIERGLVDIWNKVFDHKMWRREQKPCCKLSRYFIEAAKKEMRKNEA